MTRQKERPLETSPSFSRKVTNFCPGARSWALWRELVYSCSRQSFVTRERTAVHVHAHVTCSPQLRSTGCLRCKCASTDPSLPNRDVPWSRVERRPGTPEPTHQVATKLFPEKNEPFQR